MFVVDYEQRFGRAWGGVRTSRSVFEELAMTAIAYPSPSPQRGRHLRLVPPPTRRRPRSRAIYWWRRVVVLVAGIVFVFVARAALGAFGGGPLTAPEAPEIRP